MNEKYAFSALKGTTGRLMGVDFGDKRTGLALTDPTRFLASGYKTVSPGGIERVADLIAAEAKEHSVSGIVVGHPVNMDGSEGWRAERAEKLCELLSARLILPVVLLDERMSTMNASRYLHETNTRGAKYKAAIDALSAEIILQNAIDRLKFL